MKQSNQIRKPLDIQGQPSRTPMEQGNKTGEPFQGQLSRTSMKGGNQTGKLLQEQTKGHIVKDIIKDEAKMLEIIRDISDAYHKCTFKDGWTNKNEFHRRVQIYEVITSHTNYRVGESKHHPKLVKKMNEIVQKKISQNSNNQHSNSNKTPMVKLWSPKLQMSIYIPM